MRRRYCALKKELKNWSYKLVRMKKMGSERRVNEVLRDSKSSLREWLSNHFHFQLKISKPKNNLFFQRIISIKMETIKNLWKNINLRN